MWSMLAVGDPTPDCASPSSGSLSGLTPEAAAVVRTATVLYTPSGAAGPTDSFEFEVCGTIAASEVCDIAWVAISIEAPLPLAENIAVAIEAGQEVTIPLVGNTGGAGGAAPSSVEDGPISDAGPGSPLFGTLPTPGRLVYIGTGHCR